MLDAAALVAVSLLFDAGAGSGNDALVEDREVPGLGALFGAKGEAKFSLIVSSASSVLAAVLVLVFDASGSVVVVVVVENIRKLRPAPRGTAAPRNPRRVIAHLVLNKTFMVGFSGIVARRKLHSRGVQIVVVPSCHHLFIVVGCEACSREKILKRSQTRDTFNVSCDTKRRFGGFQSRQHGNTHTPSPREKSTQVIHRASDCWDQRKPTTREPAPTTNQFATNTVDSNNKKALP